MVPRRPHRGRLGEVHLAHGGAVLVEQPRGVGEQDELRRPHRLGDLAGHEVGVDVVAAAVGRESDGGDDGDAVSRHQVVEEGGVDLGHLSHEAEIEHLAVSVSIVVAVIVALGIDAGNAAAACGGAGALTLTAAPRTPRA